ncbi:hypothetical protein [Halobacillus halophilus]|uniref:hypothetical protein n=1 Tax=Halobacillus halophilus TaxID=1570 RepID=UPI001CD3BEBC|nr:hypothetical protein [Halobacillus halophilus]MCA1010776.1 hypothetical protein [Halobacillus halophilus]
MGVRFPFQLLYKEELFILNIRFITAVLLFFVLAGCQSNLDLNDRVASIEVYEWDKNRLVATIVDQEFIKTLVNKLDGARTSSTENMDFEMPDYKLLFKHDKEVIYEIGYYKEVVHLGLEGQYWESDQIYGVKMKLPFE